MPGVLYVPVEKLVSVLGLPMALKLAERFGGRRLYVPHPSRLKDEHPIARSIGFEAARQLAEEWQELEIMLPLCAERLRRERNRAVRDDYGALSARLAALKWETTERNIFRIWAGEDDADIESDPPAASKQSNLF